MRLRMRRRARGNHKTQIFTETQAFKVSTAWTVENGCSFQST